MLKSGERITAALLLTTAALTTYVVAGPRGLVRTWWHEVRATRAQRAAFLRSEPDLQRLGQRLGALEGRLPLYEFSDYQCPYCRQAESILASLVDSVTGVVRVYLHLPLSSHPAAFGAAVAAECAGEQGVFRQMHTGVAKRQQLDTGSCSRRGSELGRISRVFAWSRCGRESSGNDRPRARAWRSRHPHILRYQWIARGYSNSGADCSALLSFTWSRV